MGFLCTRYDDKWSDILKKVIKGLVRCREILCKVTLTAVEDQEVGAEVKFGACVKIGERPTRAIDSSEIRGQALPKTIEYANEKITKKAQFDKANVRVSVSGLFRILKRRLPLFE